MKRGGAVSVSTWDLYNCKNGCVRAIVWLDEEHHCLRHAGVDVSGSRPTVLDCACGFIGHFGRRL